METIMMILNFLSKIVVYLTFFLLIDFTFFNVGLYKLSNVKRMLISAIISAIILIEIIK